MIEADVVDVYEVVSYYGLDVVLLGDLDVQVLEALHVGRCILLDVDDLCLSLLLDVDGLMLSIAATAAV